MTQCPQSHPLNLLSPETSLKPLDKSMFKNSFLELKKEPPTLPQLRKHQSFKAMGSLFCASQNLPPPPTSGFNNRKSCGSFLSSQQQPPFTIFLRGFLLILPEDFLSGQLKRTTQLKRSRFIQVQPPSLAQRELYTHNSPQTSAISQLEKFL